MSAPFVRSVAFDKVLDEWIDGIEGEFVPREEAEKVIAHAAESEAGALNEWLLANASELVARHFSLILRRRRGGAVSRARRQMTEAAQPIHEPGWVHEAAAKCRLLDATYEVSPDGTHLRVAEMTGAHHDYLADRARQRSDRLRVTETFHRKVARLVGDKRTGDVFDERRYASLFQSTVREMARRAAA